jgi:hypothetical protein
MTITRSERSISNSHQFENGASKLGGLKACGRGVVDQYVDAADSAIFEETLV